MIEIPVWFFTTAIFVAFGAGFGIGRYLKPTITTQTGYCGIPKQGIEYYKLYSDNKVADVTCACIGENKICTQLNKKCIYLS